MAWIELTTVDADDILAGQPLPGRADLGAVVEIAAFLRASGAGEPAPPMSTGLLRQIAGWSGS
ncbi:MAG TPA: hypothetical protein VKB57_12720 [Acidimicrobiales bacterium]|nr:hypothetical protein [Acidimicrobiales bacterium]